MGIQSCRGTTTRDEERDEEDEEDAEDAADKDVFDMSGVMGGSEIKEEVEGGGVEVGLGATKARWCVSEVVVVVVVALI